MTKKVKWRDLEPNKFNLMTPPMIEVRLTGAVAARQDNKGTIILEYEDWTMESADLPDFELIDQDNWFTVVETVQTAARALA